MDTELNICVYTDDYLLGVTYRKTYVREYRQTNRLTYKQTDKHKNIRKFTTTYALSYIVTNEHPIITICSHLSIIINQNTIKVALQLGLHLRGE